MSGWVNCMPKMCLTFKSSFWEREKNVDSVWSVFWFFCDHEMQKVMKEKCQKNPKLVKLLSEDGG